MKKVLPVGAAIVCGLIVLLDAFIPDPYLNAVGTALVEGVTILAAFALLLGILNILTVHTHRVFKEHSGRGLSLVLVLSLVATLAIGIALPHTTALKWVFSYIYYPLQSTMTALLAFFSVSAAYRAFRLRHVDALVLLVASLFMLFTQLPFSGALVPHLPAVRDWFLAVPVTASMRGIILGVAFGTVTTSLRILSAIDQPYTRE